MQSARTQFWDFAEALENASTVEEVGAVFLAEVTRLGFRHVGLVSEVDPLNPGPRGVAFTRLPKKWVSRYSRERYYRDDPVHREAKRRVTPFVMNHPRLRKGLTPLQSRVMKERQAANLGDGVVIPLRAPGALPACCTLHAGSKEISPDSYAMAHSLAVMAHAAACRRLALRAAAEAVRLTKRERECLVLAAQGKSDWEIGEILTLSERTVHHSIERAKTRLGVATRVQAIVRAIHEGEIATTEVMIE